MTEWAVLLIFALGVCAFIAWPLAGEAAADRAAGELAELSAEHDSLLLVLRGLDEDADAGRISATDRAEGRRALGPRLREVTEALRRLEGFERAGS